MSGPFLYQIFDSGVIVSNSAESAEATLRDLWKNVEPWLNQPTITITQMDAEHELGSNAAPTREAATPPSETGS